MGLLVQIRCLPVCAQGPLSCKVESRMRSEEETGCKLGGLGRKRLPLSVMPHSGNLRNPRILNLNLASPVFQRYGIKYFIQLPVSLISVTFVLCHIMFFIQNSIQYKWNLLWTPQMLDAACSTRHVTESQITECQSCGQSRSISGNHLILQTRKIRSFTD